MTREREPWFSACDEETQLREMREFAAGLTDDLGPMFGRDVVRLIDQYRGLVAAAQKYVNLDSGWLAWNNQDGDRWPELRAALEAANSQAKPQP